MLSRERAQELLAKLLALADPDRGGTWNEREVAWRKAAVLAARYGLSTEPAPPPPPPPRRFAAPPRGAAWFFDPTTGAHAGAVKVHEYRDRANWRIELTHAPPRFAPGFAASRRRPTLPPRETD